MKAYRAVMQYCYWNDCYGDQEYWRTLVSEWYSSKELAEKSIERLNKIKIELAKENTQELIEIGEDFIFHKDVLVEFKPCYIETIIIKDKYQEINY